MYRYFLGMDQSAYKMTERTCNTNESDYVRYTLYSELKSITSEKKTSRSGKARYAENDGRLMAVAMGGLPAEGKFYLSINFEQMERFVLFADFLIFTDVRSR